MQAWNKRNAEPLHLGAFFNNNSDVKVNAPCYFLLSVRAARILTIDLSWALFMVRPAAGSGNKQHLLLPYLWSNTSYDGILLFFFLLHWKMHYSAHMPQSSKFWVFFLSFSLEGHPLNSRIAACSRPRAGCATQETLHISPRCE